jgi:signal transduction histidine kinase
MGAGIASDELPKVREPYYRGKNSKGSSGMGLGLYFVELIVKAHLGQLLIESDVAKGTRVIIDLPQSRDAKP